MRSGNGHDVCVTEMAGDSRGAVGKVRSRRCGKHGQMEGGFGALKGIRFKITKGRRETPRTTSVTIWIFSGQTSGSSLAAVR